MLEGLEAVEIDFQEMEDSASTLRLDPEYFQKQHLLDAKYVNEKAELFNLFKEFGLKVDASAFYPSIEGYYDQGNLPFLRVTDVDSVIDHQSCTTIPSELCDRFPTLARVRPGDIVFTKGGSVARIGLVTHEAAASRDLIFINSSVLSEADRVFLYIYFQTSFFNRALVRSSSQTAQPHLTLALVRELPIFIGTQTLKDRCLAIVQESYAARENAIQLLKNAEKTLLHTLNLENWQPPSPLSYTRSSADVFTAGRFDAEHFKPKFAELITHIENTGNAARLGTLLAINDRGNQPEYTDSGLPVVNSKHIANCEARLDSDNRVGLASAAKVLIEPGDVLMNGTGVGTIGRSAPYLHAGKAIPDNHVTILRPKNAAVDPVYLSVFINSQAGQLQVEQRLHGSSGQIELYPTDIADFTVWLAPKAIQQEIRQAVENGFIAKQRATQLLEAAKRAVEIAIEDSETAALAYLADFS